MTTPVTDPALTDSPASPARPLWRNRDFLILFSGQAVSSLGTQVSQLAFPLLVLFVTHSPAQAGLIGAARAIPNLLFGLPAGALVDRWDRKRVMLICDSLRALLLGSIPIALVLGRLSLPQLYAVTFAEGALSIFFGLAETAAIPRVVSRAQLPTASAVNEGADSTTLLLGPSLSGILYSLGVLLPFLTDAVSYLASVISILFLRTPFQEERTAPRQRLRVEITEGVTWLWRQPLIRFIAVLTGGLILSSYGYALIIIVLAQRQHASAATIGFILAAGGVGSIFGAVLAAPLQQRFSFGQIMIGTSWFWALSWLLFAIAPNPLILGIANAIGYIIIPIYMGTQFSYRLALIPDALQGRVNSVFRLVAFGTQPLSLALTGFLLQAFGPIPTVLITFIPQVLLAAAVTLNPHVRNAPSIRNVSHYT